MKHTSRSHVAIPEGAPLVPGGNPPRLIEAGRLGLWPTEPLWDAIHLDSCLPFEHIAVRTRRTGYEVVVLPGNSGEVLVRGGCFFKEFQRARLAGSTFGGSAIRMKTIEVGCSLELHVDGTRIVTSPVESVLRVRADSDRPPVM